MFKCCILLADSESKWIYHELRNAIVLEYDSVIYSSVDHVHLGNSKSMNPSFEMGSFQII